MHPTKEYQICIKQLLTDRKGEVDNNTKIGGGFNIPSVSNGQIIETEGQQGNAEIEPYSKTNGLMYI